MWLDWVSFFLQDVEYMASLMADREKEINALKEAESHSLKKEKSWNELLEEVVCLLDYGVTV